ncbi:glycosyltransferase [Rufibacter hautae]|uniref:Glycosyltransferase family 4 protein n=1 Tax=Rufibacter hautae TaxID=2595005 RepID=A0A5B6TBN0_9BACT|nr:glycosyltransferase [Rufibacter hautae]KAA3437578.1 glycosyltransferase family 4 protein [Rufibacter hautae]
MRIVHVIEPFASGVAVFVKSLAESMPGDLHIVIHGERQQVMSANDVKQIFPKENVRFIRWKSAQRSIHPFKDLLALKELHYILNRLTKRGFVDAVHLHSSKSGLLGRLACRLAGIKNVIYTPNGAPFLSNDNPVLNLLLKQVERFGNKMGGKVVCCSASELAEYQKLGIAATYINNGVAIGNSKLSIVNRGVDRKFTVITTGRIETQKNPALFNSIASFLEDYDQIEFIWAGDGQARNLLNSKNITVTGWLGPKAVMDLVSSADIFISTSQFEGLSFSVLEALALKKPVLLSDCVGNRDIVRSGLNGDVFKNEIEGIGKILHYFNNQEMLDVMGQYSLNICEKDFNVDLNLKGYRTVYHIPEQKEEERYLAGVN